MPSPTFTVCVSAPHHNVPASQQYLQPSLLGDDATTTELEARVDELDVDGWWARNKLIRNALQIQAKKQAQPTETTHLHNPYAGVPFAWQLTETVDAFLDRLPPATTDEDSVGPWIFICNPYIQRKSRAEGQSQNVRGSEDEAPEEEGANLPMFIEGGMDRLHLVTQFHNHLNQAIVAPTARTREINKAAADASMEILQLAHVLRVRAGKWMLFCNIHTVDEVWGIVAKATANNELGIAAKVATRREDDYRQERIVCVYTSDFANKADVERVATKLKQLGLVPARGKPLYYKPGQSSTRILSMPIPC
jgi:hypothetical protein